MRWLVLACAVVFAVAGVLIVSVAPLDDRARPGATSAHAAVAAYLDAFNDRDGTAICRLLTRELAVGLRLGADAHRCARKIKNRIQDPADARRVDIGDGQQYPAFFWRRASRLRRALRQSGNRARVDVLLAHERVPNIPAVELCSANETLNPSVSGGSGADECRSPAQDADRIWLVRRHARWFVMRPGRIYWLAAGGTPPPRALQAPLTAAAARRAARLPPPPHACSQRPRQVTQYVDRDPASAQIAPWLDIRRVELRRLPGAACVALTLAGRPRLLSEIVVSFMTCEREEPGYLLAYRTMLRLAIDNVGRGAVRVVRDPSPGASAGGRTLPNRARGRYGGHGRTVQFRIDPLRGRTLPKFAFRAFSRSLRELDPVQVRADTFPGASYSTFVPHRTNRPC